jgi:3-oxoacyl-[acyl-carrier-protein] synthase-3
VRQGKIQRGDLVLMAAFGAGLTWAASVVRW